MGRAREYRQERVGQSLLGLSVVVHRGFSCSDVACAVAPYHRNAGFVRVFDRPARDVATGGRADAESRITPGPAARAAEAGADLRTPNHSFTRGYRARFARAAQNSPAKAVDRPAAEDAAPQCGSGESGACSYPAAGLVCSGSERGGCIPFLPCSIAIPAVKGRSFAEAVRRGRDQHLGWCCDCRPELGLLDSRFSRARPRCRLRRNSRERFALWVHQLHPTLA